MKPAPTKEESSSSSRSLTPAQRKLQSRLDGGGFRYLNEKLYTSTSKEAFNFLSSDPTLFQLYHRGYNSQTQNWPYSPLDHIIAYLNTLPKDLIVADCGCGNARLAKEVKQRTVHSFDLVSLDDSIVTVADIANLPLADESVDVCVFCLSLMGTNYKDFLQEAARILRVEGKLLIVEVASRFPGADTTQFTQGVERLGFREVPKEDQRYFLREDKHWSATPKSGRKRQFNRRERKSRKRRRPRLANTVDEASGSDTRQPFFHSFMFIKTKANSVAKKPNIELPVLRACAYKKR